MSGMRLSMRVWDLPVRLFHWAVVLLLAASFLTGSFEKFGWHFLSGYVLLTLLLFRLVWGFVGSDTARFRAFVVSPIAGWRHLRAWRRAGPDQIGHNEAGGWMVLVLLFLLTTQILSGLFTSEDGKHGGPLFRLVSPAAARFADIVHHLNLLLLLIATTVHVLAIVAYAIWRRENLLRPMVTGKKRLPAAMRAPRMASPVLALLVLVCAAGVVTLLVTNLAAPR